MQSSHLSPCNLLHLGMLCFQERVLTWNKEDGAPVSLTRLNCVVEGAWIDLQIVTPILGFKESQDNCTVNFPVSQVLRHGKLFSQKEGLIYAMVMHSESCGVYWGMNVMWESKPKFMCSAPSQVPESLRSNVLCLPLAFRSILEESFAFNLMNSRSSAAHMMTPSLSGIFWMTQLPKQNPLVPRPEHTPTSQDK